MITLTLTTCKRPELFCKTIKNFSQNCLDKDLISEIIWADDHSSFDVFSMMRECLFNIFEQQKIKVLRRVDGSRGQAHSLNSILNNVNTKYIYHLEDDFIHDRMSFQIIPSLMIMREFNFIKQVLLNERPSFFKTLKTKNNITFKVWEKDVLQDNGEPVEHYGFTLNPSVIDIEYYINNFGYFNLEKVEGSYVESYLKGARTACLDNIKLIHLGENNSAFHLNGTNR